MLLTAQMSVTKGTDALDLLKKYTLCAVVGKEFKQPLALLLDMGTEGNWRLVDSVA